MPRGKSINLFLMDGDVNGRIKCTLANWSRCGTIDEGTW